MQRRCPSCKAVIAAGAAECPWCFSQREGTEAHAGDAARLADPPPYLGLFVYAPLWGVIGGLVGMMLWDEAARWLPQAWNQLLAVRQVLGG